MRVEREVSRSGPTENIYLAGMCVCVWFWPENLAKNLPPAQGQMGTCVSVCVGYIQHISYMVCAVRACHAHIPHTAPGYTVCIALTA